MGSGCGTFAGSSPLEGDIDYSHLPKLGADKKVRIGQGNNLVILFAQIPSAAFSILL